MHLKSIGPIALAMGIFSGCADAQILSGADARITSKPGREDMASPNRLAQQKPLADKDENPKSKTGTGTSGQSSNPGSSGTSGSAGASGATTQGGDAPLIGEPPRSGASPGSGAGGDNKCTKFQKWDKTQAKCTDIPDPRH